MLDMVAESIDGSWLPAVMARISYCCNSDQPGYGEGDKPIEIFSAFPCAPTGEIWLHPKWDKYDSRIWRYGQFVACYTDDVGMVS